jgi:DNA-binding NtrC family response regulator
VISVAVLPEKVRSQRSAVPGEAPGMPTASNGTIHLPEGGLDLEKYIQQLERGYIVAAIAACNGVGTHAAELLKMSYRSFRHYSKKYNIT